MVNPQPSSAPKQQNARLFFAIWPDGRTRDALDLAGKRLHRSCGGRRTRAETLHITLVFLGDVAVERIDTLCQLAQTIRGTAFDLPLTRLGWWKHNRVAWAAPRETPAAMSELVAGLENGLRELGLQFDQRPYLPHATLLRKAQCRAVPQLEMPIVWEVGEFVLVRSRTTEHGAAYEVIGRWLLQREKQS